MVSLSRMPADPARILIVGPSWVGDMIMAQSLFQELASRYPGAEIDVLAPPWSLPILARMTEVHEGLELAVGHGELGLRKRRALARVLRRRDYDWAIVLPRSLKSSLVPFFAGIPRRTGFRGEMRFGFINDMRALDRDQLGTTVQRIVALGREKNAPVTLQEISTPRLQVDPSNRTRMLTRLALDTTGPIVAVMPGAEYGASKRWPAASFIDLGRSLAADGCRMWVFGSAREAELGETICAGVGEAALNLCGRTRLEDAVDLVSLARCAVTNDSGLMHLAAAVGIPVIALFGSSTPLYTPPLTDRADILYAHLWCSPCFERTCPLGHTNCLHLISAGDVYRHCRALL